MLEEYFSLLIIVTLAFITPLIFIRIGVPVVVGEILLGLSVGFIFFIYRSFTGDEVLAFGEPVAFLANIGFIFLMFLSGLEIDFMQVESAGKRIILKGVLMFGGALIIAYPLSILISGITNIAIDAAYMTLILSTTSVAVVLSVVREMKISRSQFGQELIISAVIADIGAMVLITIFAIRMDVLRTGDPMFGLIAVSLFLLIFFIFYAAYKIGSWAIWYYPELLKKFFRSDDPHEVGVRASLAIIFVFVAVSAVIESEALAVIGAFLAGAVISLVFQEGALLEKKLHGIGYGFLVPIFFIHLGITFNFEAILNVDALVLLPSLLVITLFAKVIPSLVITFK
ncbi:MAG: cation:proton antiporter [Methanomassiliicoccales archaeon]